jgi:putative DNA primase/helicase
MLPELNCYAHAGIDYWEQDENGKPVSKGKFPAIVSAFRDEDDKLASYHITYIGEDGNKPDLEIQKRILPPIFPITGTAIKLFPHTSVLCIVEGIESGLSAYMDSGFPVWVAGNANNMAKMKIPPEIKAVYIYEDSDKSFAGRLASSTLANRLSIQYPEMIIKIVALVEREQVIVAQDKYDMNDYIILNQAA